jgi:sec-independent protein translocase protein TatB
MFNIGSGELVLIAVVALLVLGPKRLPELARGLGKFLREFRRQTDEVRGVVEREFYRMDQEIEASPPAAQLAAAADPVPVPVTSEGAIAVEPEVPMDHSDPRHPDYGKPDPHVLPEDPAISHHLDPTPTHVEAPIASMEVPAVDPEKKAG